MRISFKILYLFFCIIFSKSVFAGLLCHNLFSTLDQNETVFAELSKKVLYEKLYAVHMTDYLPKNGVLKAVTKDRARFSATLHFSLGEPVLDHASNIWSNKKFAILLPLKELRPQLANIFAQDSFIVGDLVLNKNSILLIPVGQLKPSDFPGSIVYYQNEIGLVESVKLELEKMKSIILRSTGPHLSNKIFYNNIEIDQKKLFKDFISDKTSMELHSTTVFGELDVALIQFFANWFYRDKPTSFSLQELKLKKIGFEELIYSMNTKVLKMNLPQKAKESYDDALKDVQEFMNIIDLEIYAQEKFNKTVLNLKGTSKLEILKLKNNIKNLVNYFELNQNNFDSPSRLNPEKNDEIYFLKNVSSELHYLDLESFMKIVLQKKNFGSPQFNYIYEFIIFEKISSLVIYDHNYVNLLVQQLEILSDIITPAYLNKINYILNNNLSEEIKEKIFKNKKVSEFFKKTNNLQI